jgi:hypothetical protein
MGQQGQLDEADGDGFIRCRWRENGETSMESCRGTKDGYERMGLSGMEILASLSIDSMGSGGGRFTSLGRSF